MPVASFVKFQPFLEAVVEKVHNLGADTLMIALSNTAPNATTNAVLADITQISPYTNLSSRVVTTSSSAVASGVYRLFCADLTLTASGAVPTFRYVILYNSTPAAGNLIGYWDNGTAVTMANLETYKLDFDNVNGVLTLS
jgi:hypothetical protein